ncbi:MAG: TolC family protein [Deltaproteobacteria bacterium]|nr:TolC family protein [Deltaproteobacteria bacterium]MDL1986275.1 TolC family protein [Deltaproteobacteria bacterium]
MFRRFLLLLFTTGICFFVSAMALAGDDSYTKEELTIEQAIKVALKNNPSIRVANEACIAGRARIGQTESAYYPQIDFQSRYSRSWQEAGQSLARNNYGNTLQLNQLIFDFYKTPSLVGSTRENYESLKESCQNTRQTVALNTKAAYYSYLAAQREVKLNEETVRQREELVHHAKEYFRTGLKPRIDVTRTEANLYDAKLSFIRAQNGLQIAKINLVNALGIEKLPWNMLRDILEIKKPVIMNLADAKRMATKQRPDLLQNEALERERKFSLKATKADYLPRLSGNANYGWSSTDFPLQEEWTVGMQLTFPLFTGFKKREKIKEDEAKLRQVKASGDVIIQNILAEVEQAYRDMNTASEQIVAARKGRHASTENLELATKRYQQGLNHIIEVTDAQVQYLTAETKYINSLYDYKIAEAMLEKAIGKSY